MDEWEVVALVFFVLMLACAVLAWLLHWIDAHNPMNHTRRCIDGRKAMASDYEKPAYLPESWK